VTEHDSFQSRWLGIVTVVLTLGGWTIVPVLIKEFTGDVDPGPRTAGATGSPPCCWAPLLLWRRAKKAGKPGLYRAALVPGAINAAAQVCFTTSFYMIDPGWSRSGCAPRSSRSRSAPRSCSRASGGDPHPGFLIGLALLMGGTLTTIGLSGEFGERAGTVGVVLAMLAGRGLRGLRPRRAEVHDGLRLDGLVRRDQPVHRGAMIVLMLIFGERAGATALDMELPRFGLFLLSAIIGIAAGHVLYYISIEKLGVTVSSGVIQLQPFTVAALSFFWFGERLTIPQWLFGAVAVVGAIAMIVVQHRVKRRTRGPARAGPRQGRRFRRSAPGRGRGDGGDPRGVGGGVRGAAVARGDGGEPEARGAATP
jgi:drug/metabolite transporter (DMT)-like permease